MYTRRKRFYPREFIRRGKEKKKKFQHYLINRLFNGTRLPNPHESSTLLDDYEISNLFLFFFFFGIISRPKEGSGDDVTRLVTE